MANGGSLPFPVEGARQRDIGSPFGVPRGDGAREHHGVDIFAERGTPVIAVIDGRVRTGTGARGGKHVWLSGSMIGLGNARYYYAHLNAFEVESGDRVIKRRHPRICGQHRQRYQHATASSLWHLRWWPD